MRINMLPELMKGNPVLPVTLFLSLISLSSRLFLPLKPFIIAHCTIVGAWGSASETKELFHLRALNWGMVDPFVCSFYLLQFYFIYFIYFIYLFIHLFIYFGSFYSTFLHIPQRIYPTVTVYHPEEGNGLLRWAGMEWLELSLASHHLLAPVKRYNRIDRERETGRGEERWRGSGWWQ